MIARLCEELPIQHRSRIITRIEALESYRLEELDSGDLSLSLLSLENFTTFLSNRPDLEYPTLTLDPSGFIYAEWKTAPTQHFTVVR